MQKRTNYNTKQKDEILDTIKKMDKAFLIKELYVKLNEKVGLTTIYRFIDKMVENEELYKYIGEDNNTYYQYLEKCDCNNHFYLKCINCGNMIHVDCDCIKELSNHITKEHNFIPNKENIIINGICSKCKNY